MLPPNPLTVSAQPWHLARWPRLRLAGFTLVELLVVIAVIAILALLLMPVVKSSLLAAKSAKCKQNLKQLAAAYMSYASDHDGSVVTDGKSPYEWTRVIQPYLGYETFQISLVKEFTCPAAPKRKDASYWQPDYAGNVHGALYGLMGDGGASLGISAASTAPMKLAGQERPSKVIAFLDWIPGWRYARRYEFARVNDQDKERVFRHSGKLNAVFVDGHVETIDYPLPTNHLDTPWR